MDKYAPYVWSAYAITVSLIVFLTAFIAIRMKNSKNKLERLQAEEDI
ncbi:heme exporter protein CcmD [Hirschia maritima]